MQMTLTPWKHVIITAIASLSLATSCSDTTPERGPLANASLADTATMLGVGSTGAVGPGFLEGSMTVSAGEHHTCAIDSEGVKCWGYNEDGQTDVPQSLKNPQMVSAGDDHTCAIDSEGVKCWGSNGWGKTNVPQGLKNPQMVSAGDYHTCALDSEGVKCWGSNDVHQTDVPQGLKNPQMVSAGWGHTCAIDDDGIKCWGYNGFGQTNVPAGLKNPKMVSAGFGHTCALDNDGVKCWGSNDWDELNVPAGLKNPRVVSAASQHTCAIDDEGVKCWGRNDDGQTNVPRGLKNPKMVSAGVVHTCAVDSEGVKCWGDNEYGQTNVPTLNNKTGFKSSFISWLRHYAFYEKARFLDLIATTIVPEISSTEVTSASYQALVLLMTNWVLEFPSEYYQKQVKPKWISDLKFLSERTGIRQAKDVPLTKESLTVGVKLLHASLTAVKPMLGTSEQKEVESMILEVNDTLSSALTKDSAQDLARKILRHDQLINSMDASASVHTTAVLLRDVTGWILER